MQLDHLYRETVSRLQLVGIDDASNDAAQLFEFFLGVSRERIFLHPDQEISKQQALNLEEALCRRLAREPLQYIVGTREFWSLDFVVSPAVLVPRPETEFLLDRVLSVTRKSGFMNGPVLDMCTGSGVIGIIMAMELKASTVLGVDKSFAALQVAASNVRKHDQAESVHLLCSDLFAGLRSAPMFEIIVANPPYIPHGDFGALQPEVRDWEPESALLAGKRGLDIIEILARQGHGYLGPGGWIFIEIGSEQEEDVYSLFAVQAQGAYDSVEVLKDWSGRPRVLQARKKG